jgi:hypothetical protein
MAAMSSREIEFELRECHSLLHMITRGSELASSPYLPAEDYIILGKSAGEQDRVVLDLVSRGDNGMEHRPSPISIRLYWADPTLKTKLAYTADERAKIGKERTDAIEAARHAGKREPTFRPLSTGPAAKLNDFAAFNNWRRSVDVGFNDGNNYRIESLTIHHIDHFGPRIGFVKFALTVNQTRNVTNATGKTEKKKGPIPGVVSVEGLP